MNNTKKITSIGIILDGNRRWAKERDLPTLAGHTEGVEAIKRLFKELPTFTKEYGLKYVTLYAFSTENWDRSEEEVAYLMKLIETQFQILAKQFENEDIRIRFIGQRDRFSQDVQKLFSAIEKKTESNAGVTVSFALSYGGRPEIIEATNKAVQEGREVTEESFTHMLWSGSIPDPDIIIRTGGERRLSNFLTWKSVYSELFFVDTYWPAFTPNNLREIFEEYQKRERRHGK